MARLASVPSLTRDRLLALLLGTALFLPGLGNHDLWNPDEPRYAEVTREMRLTGNYLVPHLNGEIYAHKPPLLFWAISLAATLRGQLDETAVRLPSALSAIATMLLVLELGRRLFNRRAGWIAALASATFLKVPFQSRTGQIDMLLTFLVTLAVFFWARGFLEKRPGFYRLFFLTTGLATLAKGPVGLLPPLLSILAFLLITRKHEERKRLRIGLGLALWAAVVLAWLVPAGLAGGQTYLGEIVFTQNVTRYVSPWHHHRPFYYYLPVVAADFLPWSFLLPTALVIGFRRLEGAERERLLFAFLWVVVTIGFFSLSPAKRSVYVFTMYPGMALALAAGLDRLTREPGDQRRWFLWPTGLLCLMPAAGAFLLPRLAAMSPELVALGDDHASNLRMALGFLFLAALTAWVLAYRRHIVGTVATLGAGAATLGLVLALVLLPPFDLFKSARPLAETLTERSQPGEPLGHYPTLEPRFLFYTKRFASELLEERELRSFAQRPDRVWVLAEAKALERIEAPLPLYEIERESNPSGGWVLLSSSLNP